MKIHPLSNGKAYGWSKIRSLFDFFFPYAINGKYQFIRAESSSTSTGQYEFYTFRAFYTHYFYELFINPAKEWVAFLTSPFLNPMPLLYVGLAIAIDTGNASVEANASPFTWSHTTTGSSPLIAIGVGFGDVAAGLQASAVSYNSAAATKARADTQLTNAESSIWLKGNCATGSNTVSVTFINDDGFAEGIGIAISYSGAQSGSTADAVNGTNGTTTGAKTFNVTTIANNCWVVAVGALYRTGAGTPTLTATQTSRATGSGSTNVALVVTGEDTNTAKTPAGAQAMGFTVGGSISGWAMTGASFAPGVAAAATINFLGLMGVGS